ncbi:MAG: putative ABC transporter permease [Bacilli bacterium]|nr:putative ABC transporter permease [Bacilli bacterium]
MISIYFLLFILYSFIGWCGEIVIYYFINKRIINRGFLMGPCCPIYGCGCVLLTILLSKYTDDLVVLFCLSMIICSVLEYFTSWAMEVIFKMRWWDYSHIKFNVNGRICLTYAIPFGIIGTLVVKYINPFLIYWLNRMPNTLFNVITVVMACAFVLDVIVSSNVIFNLKNFVRDSKKDSTEDLKKEIKKKMVNNNSLYMRLVRAFPDFQKIIKNPRKKIVSKRKKKKEEKNKKQRHK